MEPLSLTAWLYFDHEPRLDLEQLAAAVPGTKPVEGDGAPVLAHPRFAYIYAGGERSTILTAFFTPDEGTEGDRVPTTEQTWDWDAADDALARCTHSLLVIEMFGRVHPPRERVEAFVPALCAAIEQLEPAAVWLPNSDRVVQPAAVLRERELAACVNVRAFRVEDSDDRFMDTLGLHVFGLPDLQCVYRDDEPMEIARLLFDVGAYLMEQGDVIEDGDDLPDRGWICHDAVSAVAPERRALTLSRP